MTAHVYGKIGETKIGNQSSQENYDRLRCKHLLTLAEEAGYVTGERGVVVDGIHRAARADFDRVCRLGQEAVHEFRKLDITSDHARHDHFNGVFVGTVFDDEGIWQRDVHKLRRQFGDLQTEPLVSLLTDLRKLIASVTKPMNNEMRNLFQNRIFNYLHSSSGLVLKRS